MFKWKPTNEIIIAFFLGYLMIWHKEIPNIFISFVILGLCGFALPIYYLIFVKGQPLSELGIRKRKWLLSIILGISFPTFLHVLQMLNTMNVVKKITVNFEAMGYIFNIMVFGIMESIFFFGFLNLRFKKAFGVIPAIILGAIFLTLFRVDPLHSEFLPIFIMALVNMSIFSLTENLLAVYPFNYIIGGCYDVLMQPDKARYFLKMLSWEKGLYILILMIIISVYFYIVSKKQLKISLWKATLVTISVPSVLFVALWLSTPPLVIKDSVLFFRLNSNYESEINSMGFRDAEFCFEKDISTFRIICMGDSVTFGDKVKSEESYPQILEKMLNATFSTKNFEVINAGIPGYTSHQGLLYLKEILKYKPDLITVYFGANDSTPALLYSDKIISQEKLHNIIYLSLKFQSLLSRISRGKTVIYRLSYKRQYKNKEARVSPEDYKKNLEEMAAIAGERNIRILFITPIWLGTNTLFSKENYELPENCSRINIVDAFEKKSKDISQFLLDWCHLSPEGHRAVAEEISEFLVEKELIPK